MKLAVLAVAGTAAVALAASYVWVDAGDGHNWDTCSNWLMTGGGEECYPSTTNDDATIPYAAGGWTVNLIDVDRMDDFEIRGSVDFVPADPNGVTLVANSLTIAGAQSAETVVEISAGAVIRVKPPEP